MISSEYLHPLNDALINDLTKNCSAKSIFQSTFFYKNEPFESSNFDLAILGIQEDRFKPAYLGCALAPDLIRKEFYALIKPRNDLRIIDLGNIHQGNEIGDSHFALSQVLSSNIKNKIVTIVLGGTQDLIAAQFSAYQGLNPNMNLLLIDAKVDMQNHDNKTELSYLPKILTQDQEYLFNITQAGYQSYYVESETYDAFERMNFDMLRLGSLRGNMQEIEPYCRNANMLGFSMQAIRAADAPAQSSPSPNGFGGDEACQLTRYAGMSNDLMSIGFYDFNPTKDMNGITAALLGQMIWYFVEGFVNKKNDYPVANSKDYMMYRTTSKNLSHEIVFYKSVLSNRWWMEVPYPRELSKQEGNFLVPCSYKDYQTAQNDELPDKWMKTYQKLL